MCIAISGIRWSFQEHSQPFHYLNRIFSTQHIQEQRKALTSRNGIWIICTHPYTNQRNRVYAQILSLFRVTIEARCKPHLTDYKSSVHLLHINCFQHNDENAPCGLTIVQCSKPTKMWVKVAEICGAVTFVPIEKSGGQYFALDNQLLAPCDTEHEMEYQQ